MDARDLVLRHGEHAERVVIAQVLLGGERKARQICQRLDLVRMHAGGVELAAIDRRMVVGMAQGPFQAIELQGLEVLPAGGLDGLQRQVGKARAHVGSTTWPLIWADLPRNIATGSPAWLVTRMS
ncbi:hypothetical protein D3C87_1416710 [compost metagenome]